MVSFGRADWTGTKGKAHICAGSLVADGSFVLTAAHCVDDDNMQGEVAEWFVKHMGISYGSTDLQQSQMALVKSVIVHPNYDPFTLKNDIALIKLDRNPVLNGDAGVACLPQSNYNIEHSDYWPVGTPEAFAAGWGYVDEDGTETRIKAKEIMLPLVKDAECESTYESNPNFSNWLNNGKVIHNIGDQTALCAGYPAGVDENSNVADACQGDSGGPLVRLRQDNAYELVGVVSWGYGCAQSYGVYSQVGTYADWIQQSMTDMVDGTKCDSMSNCLGTSLNQVT